MDLKQSIYELVQDCFRDNAEQGLSLKINAFYKVLHERGLTIEQVAQELGMTVCEIEQNLQQRRKFTKEQIRKLVYFLRARAAYYVLYFPTFRDNVKAYEAVYCRPFKNKKKRRRAWQERQS